MQWLFWQQHRLRHFSFCTNSVISPTPLHWTVWHSNYTGAFASETSERQSSGDYGDYGAIGSKTFNKVWVKTKLYPTNSWYSTHRGRWVQLKMKSPPRQIWRRRRRRRRRRTLKLLHQVVSATHIGARCLFLAVGCRVGCMQVAVKLQDHVSCVYLLPLGRLSEHLDFIITFSISISHLYHPLHLSSRNFENFSSQALLKNFDTFCKYELLRSGWDHNFLKKQEEMTSSRLWEGH